MLNEILKKANEIGFEVTIDTTIDSIKNIASKAVFLSSEDFKAKKYISEKYKMYSDEEQIALLYDLKFILELVIYFYDNEKIKLWE
jgi:hypothetical protein